VRSPGGAPVRVGRTSGAPHQPLRRGRAGRRRATARESRRATRGLRVSTLSVYYRCRCRLGFRQLEAIPNAMFTFGS